MVNQVNIVTFANNINNVNKINNNNNINKVNKMRNVIVCFANIKGGVGKTHLAAHFANYLLDKEIPVAVVDVDTQQSLTRRRERELKANPDATPNWEVHRLDPMNAKMAEAIIPQLKTVPGVVIFDCPGSVNDPALAHIIPEADIIIVPFEQDDEDVIDATVLFGETIKKAAPKANLYFMPNKVNALTERRESIRKAREYVYDLIRNQKKLGYLTQYIKQSVDIKDYSTVNPMTSNQRFAVNLAFSPIIETINKFK